MQKGRTQPLVREKFDRVTLTNAIIRKIRSDNFLKPCYKFIIYYPGSDVNEKILKA